MFPEIILGVFLAGVVFAAIHDISTMTIPNWVSLAFLIAFPIAALSADLTWAQIGWHYLAGLIALVICIGLFSVGVFGGGDAKLLPAVLVWMGPAAWLPYIFGLAVIGGCLALIVILARRLVPQTAIPGFLQRSVVEGPGIPYAVAIAGGAVWAAPQSQVLGQLIRAAGFGH